jgi:hypothetical protein
MSTSTLPKVEYRRLGNSGLRVSVPILGAMSLGTDKWWSWVKNEDEVGASRSYGGHYSILVSRHYPFLKLLGISE